MKKAVAPVVVEGRWVLRKDYQEGDGVRSCFLVSPVPLRYVHTRKNARDFPTKSEAESFRGLNDDWAAVRVG